MAVLVRPAAHRDAARIAELLDRLGHPATAEEVRARLTYWLGDPHSALLVAEVDGGVAGFAALHASPLIERTARRGRLVAIAVDGDARGRGVGRALMEAVETAARRLDCHDLEAAGARTRTGARRFYTALGFEEQCDRTSHLLKPL
ncbi:GNAT family N-acetyltransferase [Actinomadura kijaniata]|uniref:GNAT family N-acetyltransferase n=1 Tax=Actinomadura kijaniata TaxID=46161 RepID=UPI000830A350|nr:GNAT family N-acetyltransferase [Actinomadura kijaniata]